MREAGHYLSHHKLTRSSMSQALEIASLQDSASKSLQISGQHYIINYEVHFLCVYGPLRCRVCVRHCIMLYVYQELCRRPHHILMLWCASPSLLHHRLYTSALFHLHAGSSRNPIEEGTLYLS